MSAVPEHYEPGYDFSDFQGDNPDTPLPGDQVDAQLADIAAAINSTQDRLAEIQNDDGSLRAGIVGSEQIAGDLTIGMRAAVTWTSATLYQENDTVYQGSNIYRALMTHTSTVFATDLANGRWTLVVNFEQYLNAAAASVSAAEQSAAEAEAARDTAGTMASGATVSYLEFRRRYNVTSSAPSTRFDGTALEDGDLYANTTTDTLFIRKNGAWVPAAAAINGTFARTEATGNGSQTSFAVTYSPGNLFVYRAGDLVDMDDYTATNGTSVVFNSAPANGVRLDFVALGVFNVGDVADNSISTGNIQDGAVTADKSTPGPYWHAVDANVDSHNVLAIYDPALISPADGTMARVRPQVNNGGGTAKTVTSLTSAGTTGSAVCTAHGLQAGDVVYLTGASPGEYNGFVQVAAVPNANSFTFNFKGSSTSPATGTIYVIPPLTGGAYAGEVLFKPNGSDGKPIRRRDGGPLVPGDIVKDRDITLVYHETEDQWMLQSGDVPQFYALVSSDLTGTDYQATAQTLIGSRTTPMLFCIRMMATNSTTTPTLELLNAPDEMIGVIQREGGRALRLGDIVAGGWSLLQWAGSYWELLNPKSTVMPIAVLQHQMPNGTHGGTATGGVWETSPLNVEVSDPENIVTLSGNQFTLGPGTYLISFYRLWRGPGTSQARLYNASAGTPVAYGHVVYCYHSETSRGDALVTITEARNFTIQSRVDGTVGTYGYGYACNFGGVEVYGGVTIQKVA